MLPIPSTRARTDPHHRYKMPALQVRSEGRNQGTKTFIENASEVSKALHRPATYLAKFLKHELNVRVDEVPIQGSSSGAAGNSKNGGGPSNKRAKIMIKGAHSPPVLQKLVDDFIERYVLCPLCGLPEMDLCLAESDSIARKKKRSDATEMVVCGVCKACGWRGVHELGSAHKTVSSVVMDLRENILRRQEGSCTSMANASSSTTTGSQAKNPRARDHQQPRNEATTRITRGVNKDKQDEIEQDQEAAPTPGTVSPSGEEGSEEPVDQEAHGEDANRLVEALRSVLVNGEASSSAKIAFVEEARLLQASTQMTKRTLMYCCLKALIHFEYDHAHCLQQSNAPTFAEQVRASGSVLRLLIAACRISFVDLMWGFELFVFENKECCLKNFPLVCKALYDLDILDETNFLPYHTQKRNPNKRNPGHKMAKKKLKSFAAWLEVSSGDESSSDSA